MSFALLAAFLPLSRVAFWQSQSVPVTYSTRAARASLVLKEISAISKVSLETSPQTENEVLVVNAKEVPLSDLMARIAKVTSSEWKQNGSGYRLVAAANVRKQEERDDLARKFKGVQKGIQMRVDQAKTQREQMAKMFADAKKSATTNKSTDKTDKKQAEEVEMPDFSQAESPEETAITSILQSIDVSVLAEMESGDRIVFSTDPTRMQHPLAADTTEIINTMIQKHNENVAKLGPDQPETTNGMDEKQAEMFRQMMRKQNSKIGAVSKALLIFSNLALGFFSSAQIELRLYDAKGLVVFETTSNLSLSGDSMFGMINDAVAGDAQSASVTVNSDGTVLQSSAPTAVAKQRPAVSSTPIEYSEDTKAIQKAMTGMQGASMNLNLPAEIRKKLFLPNVYDPLSFKETDEVLAYARWKGKFLVADLPDSSSNAIMAFGGAIQTLEGLEKSIKEAKSLQLVPDENFITLMPADPYESRNSRLDRVALANLMQATADKGVPSLDDMSAYAKVAPNPMSGGIGQLYLLLFVPGSIQMGLDGSSSWDMLRFYGHLPSESRTLLATGGKISTGAITGPERASLERLTYGASSHLSVDDGTKHAEDDLPSWMQLGAFGGNKANDYRGEPTEVVPNGIPGDGYVELHMTTEPFAAPVPGNAAGVMAMIGVLGADELALFKILRSQKGNEEMASMFPLFAKLRVGERSVLNFTFHLAPQVSLKQSLKDHHLPKDASVYAEGSLPAEFQKLIADRMEAMKKSPFAAMGAMFGGNAAIHP